MQGETDGVGANENALRVTVTETPTQAKAAWVGHRREGFLEKLHDSTRCSAVAAAEPAVEQEVSFGQHGQQGMMTGASMLARIVAVQRALLPAIAFEDGGIQVQAVTVAALRQAPICHL